METTVNTETGILNPRIYQIFGDRIDSKQAMEPLAIAIGPGPVSGFNQFSWDIKAGTVQIGSMDIANTNSPLGYLSDLYRPVSFKGYKAISDKYNKSGKVENAHITRDGLLHVCGDIKLSFKPTNSWPTYSIATRRISPMNGRAHILLLTASHTYQDSATPGEVSFKLQDLGRLNSNPWYYLTHSVTTLSEELESSNLLDTNTETLIGIYIIGWDTKWESLEGYNQAYKSIIQNLNYNLPIVFYNSTMPLLYNSPLELLKCGYMVEKCGYMVDKLDYLTKSSTNYLILENNLTNLVLKVQGTEYRPTGVNAVSVRVRKNDSVQNSGIGMVYITLAFPNIPSYIRPSNIDLTTVQLIINQVNSSFTGELPRVELCQCRVKYYNLSGETSYDPTSLSTISKFDIELDLWTNNYSYMSGILGRLVFLVNF